MSIVESYLCRILEERKFNNSLRTLVDSSSSSRQLIDFCSNDYLGFSRSQKLLESIREQEFKYSDLRVGATGSRLISGNTKFCEDLEKRIAKFHHAEAGLIFNSGYDANLGVFSSLPQRTDTVVFDQFVHASIRDGIRLSFARAFSFKHNDLEDLRRKLNSASGNIFVAVESIYSMDGDCAPLKEMTALCEEYGANLIVDEAHATGVFGNKGKGVVVELGLENRVFARVHTFGKALGCHGAIVVGSTTLRSYLINFARSFIYTTALPIHSLISISCAYNLLESEDEKIGKLKRNIRCFKENIKPAIRKRLIESTSAIQCVIVPGNENVKEVAHEIQRAGFDVRPILHPTVPKGAERLRICIHAFNTENDIAGLTEIVNRQLLSQGPQV
jgi:8-amino-7-oxononanoate synthase